MVNATEKKISLAREASAGRKKTTALIALAAALAAAAVVAVMYLAPPARVADDGGGAPAGNAGDAGDNGDAATARASFKRQLKTFQSETEPALLAASVARWAPDIKDDILARKEKALRAFNAGNYPSAAALLQGAADAAAGALQLAGEKYRAGIDTATRALRANDVEAAREGIALALMLKPNEAAARALQSRIEVLPEVIRLLALADRALAENDRRARRAHLAEVVRLDPAREDVRAQVQALAADIAERDFAAHIAGGMDAVAKRDLGGALQFMKQAEAIHPAREEVALLRRDIRRLDREMTLQKHLAAARRAADSDDWNAARAAYARAEAVDGADAEAVDGAKLAAQVVGAHDDIAGYLARPQRLSSENVAAMAEDAVRRAQSFYRISAGLRKRAQQLETLIADYAAPVPVVVRSDNKTTIVVRGVGEVGKTRERTVDLKPGTYTFEGRRAGYRSKLIQVEVRPGAGPPQVTLICDERV